MSDQEPWKKEDMVMICIHVQQQTAEAEYMKEDDSYVCSDCRDRMRDDGFDAMKDNLVFVHRSCLGI